jgi:hypothetical protein
LSAVKESEPGRLPWKPVSGARALQVEHAEEQEPCQWSMQRRRQNSASEARRMWQCKLGFCSAGLPSQGHIDEDAEENQPPHQSQHFPWPLVGIHLSHKCQQFKHYGHACPITICLGLQDIDTCFTQQEDQIFPGHILVHLILWLMHHPKPNPATHVSRRTSMIGF